MLQVDLKSASNFKDLDKKNCIILFLKAQIQFRLINFDICDWWIENDLHSDWLNDVWQLSWECCQEKKRVLALIAAK